RPGELVLVARGEKSYVDGDVSVLRVAVHGHLPPAQGTRWPRSSGGTRGQRRDREVARGCPVRAQAEGVWPVAHEGSVALLPDRPGALFRERGDFVWADCANPSGGPLHRSDGVRVVDADNALRFDYRSSAVGVDPFQAVDRKPRVGISLPHIAPEIPVAVGALTRLDGRGHVLKLGPCRWRASERVLGEKIGPVVQQPNVCEQRQSN